MSGRNQNNQQNNNQWPESHYSLQSLGKWFLAASSLLLILIVSIFYKDYNSEWRAYQKEFRRLESAQTQVQLDQELKKLESSKEFDRAQKNLADMQAKFDQHQKDYSAVTKKLDQANDTYDRLLSAYQYAKADFDALKYKLQAVRTHHAEGDVDSLEKKFSAITVKKDKLFVQSERARVEQKNVEEEQKALLKSVNDAERKLREVTQQRDILQRKLQTTDPGAMDTMNALGSMVRDLPVLDMLNPYYKIDQIVVKDIKDDLNFAKVPKVDRCISCHKGIMTKGFEDAPQPYRTHPNLELFLSSESAHPVQEFACTACHQGRGRGTSFQSAAHTPNSPEQAKEWEEKYHWHPMHHWDYPMLPKKHVEASCLKCHNQETTIKGADKLNLGLKLIEQSGCYACHKIDKFSGFDRPAPNLKKMADKLTNDSWTYHWIHNPKDVKHNAWMPSYFDQTNNSDAASKRRSEQEVHAIKAFLYEKSQSYDMKDVPVKGDPVKGEELVSSLGCYGCHQVQPDASVERDLTLTGLTREHGPNLLNLGSKTNAKWLFNWLKDPKSYHPGTTMPNLRLSDQEAADISAYLVSKKDEALEQDEVAGVDPKVLDQITLDFMHKIWTQDQAKEKLSQMTSQEKLLYSGERLVSHYGCSSCHEIAGKEDALPIGPELNGIASKPLHQFDFGFLHVPHAKHEWLYQKLKDPRSFDHGKILEPLDKLIMPNFGFSDQEAEAIVTALMGLVKFDSTVKMPEETQQTRFVQEGQKLIRQLNCQGCHVIEGVGGAIQPKVSDWLQTYEGKSANDAKAMSLSFSAPNLVGEGKKVHSDWLFGFLHDPSTIRPWLKLRMPTYGLSDEDLNTLVMYFKYHDDQGEVFSHLAAHANKELLDAGQMLASPDYFDCGNCHIQGDKMPAGSPDRWAPNFALAKKRLKPEWVIEWLYDPQKLLPGTKMPTYFDPEYFDYSGPEDVLGGDEHKHIRALTEYVVYGSSQKAPKDSEELS